MAEEVRIVWSPAAVRRLHPRRGSANAPPWRLAARMRPAVFRERLYDERMFTCQECLGSGLVAAHLGPDDRRRAEATRDRWRDPQAYTTPLVVEHEALAWYFWNHLWHEDAAHRKLPGWWLRVEEPAFALRALAAARRLRLRALRSLGQGPDAWLPERDTAGFALLRAGLSVAPEDELERARAAAAALWPDADHALRCALAFTFPDGRAWGDEALLACVARGRPDEQSAQLVVASGASPERLTRLVDLEPYPGCLARYTPDFVDRNGVEALPGLLYLYRAINRLQYQKDLSLALAVFRCQAVADVFAARLDDWRQTPALEEEYLSDQPELARPALEKAAGTRARALLRRLA